MTGWHVYSLDAPVFGFGMLWLLVQTAARVGDAWFTVRWVWRRARRALSGPARPREDEVTRIGRPPERDGLRALLDDEHASAGLGRDEPFALEQIQALLHRVPAEP